MAASLHQVPVKARCCRHRRRDEHGPGRQCGRLLRALGARVGRRSSTGCSVRPDLISNSWTVLRKRIQAGGRASHRLDSANRSRRGNQCFQCIGGHGQHLPERHPEYRRRTSNLASCDRRWCTTMKSAPGFSLPERPGGRTRAASACPGTSRGWRTRMATPALPCGPCRICPWSRIQPTESSSVRRVLAVVRRGRSSEGPACPHR